MFPYSVHPPPFSAEKFFYFIAAAFIAGDFGLPVSEAGFWHTAVLWTAVPETAVNEDREVLAKKHEIGMSWHRVVTTPSGDTVGAEDLDEF